MTNYQLDITSVTVFANRDMYHYVDYYVIGTHFYQISRDNRYMLLRNIRYKSFIFLPSISIYVGTYNVIGTCFYQILPNMSLQISRFMQISQLCI